MKYPMTAPFFARTSKVSRHGYSPTRLHRTGVSARKVPHHKLENEFFRDRIFTAAFCAFRWHRGQRELETSAFAPARSTQPQEPCPLLRPMRVGEEIR